MVRLQKLYAAYLILYSVFSLRLAIHYTHVSRDIANSSVAKETARRLGWSYHSRLALHLYLSLQITHHCVISSSWSPHLVCLWTACS